MPNTTNFNFPTPADTDLVKDGASAIRSLGNSIDTAFVDLKGGTTGQILSKASNTDLDYTWINNDQGDITEVQAGTGISVASGTGPIPVVTNTVATAFDAKGDLVAGTGADTFAKLTVGANNTVLTADSSTATGLKWAAAAGGGKVLQVVQATHSTEVTSTSTTWADTGLTATITPSATTSKILVLMTTPFFNVRDNASNNAGLRLLRGSTFIFGDSSASAPLYWAGHYQGGSTQQNRRTTISFSYLDSPSTTSATTYKTQLAVQSAADTGAAKTSEGSQTASIILLEIGA